MVGVTLVRELRTIDAVVANAVIGSDGEEISRQVLHSWSEVHPVVNRAIRGDCSVAELVKQLVGRYTGWRSLFPVFRGKEYDRQLAKFNLSEVLGSNLLRPTSQSKLSVFIYDKLSNPAVLVGYSLIAGAVAGFAFIPQYPLLLAPVTGLCGLSFVGPLIWHTRRGEVERALGNAQYIDTRIAALRN